MTKEDSTALTYPIFRFLCDFGHEGVNIRRYSRVLTEYPPVFRRGNPKLQETAKKHTSYDRTRFNSMSPRL